MISRIAYIPIVLPRDVGWGESSTYVSTTQDLPTQQSPISSTSNARREPKTPRFAGRVRMLRKSWVSFIRDLRTRRGRYSATLVSTAQRESD